MASPLVPPLEELLDEEELLEDELLADAELPVVDTELVAEVVGVAVELGCPLVGQAATADMADKARTVDWYFMIVKERMS